MDILDAQNVYSIDGYRKPKKSSQPIIETGNPPFQWEFEIINVVIEFTKTSCSNEYDKKKCMGTSKTDQFNGKFVERNYGK